MSTKSEIAESQVFELSVMGDLSDIMTNPKVPAARQTVEIKEPNGEFSLNDRRVYRHLVSVAQQDLANDGIAKHKLHLDSLMVNKHSSTDRIKQSVENLQKTLVQTRKENGEWFSVQLLGEASIRNGFLYFEFPEAMRNFMQNPKLYNRISIRILYHMRSKYSIILYEILSGYHKQRNPYWRVSIEDLHEYLGTTVKKSLHRPAELKRTVLQPAMEEINSRAEFYAHYRLIKRGRSITHVEFSMTTKSRDQMEIVNALLAEEMPLLDNSTSERG